KSMQMHVGHTRLEHTKRRRAHHHLYELVLHDLGKITDLQIGGFAALSDPVVRAKMHELVAFRLENACGQRIARQGLKRLQAPMITKKTGPRSRCRSVVRLDFRIEIAEIERRRNRKERVRIVRTTLISDVKAARSEIVDELAVIMGEQVLQ